MKDTSTAKKALTELLKEMQPDHAHLVEAVYEDYRDIIKSVPGSSTKHQVWPGGLLSHIEETMNIVVILYASLNKCRPLKFTLSDALLCAFLHDFDKVQRYRIVDGQVVKNGNYDSDYVKKTISMIHKDYGYKLSPEHINALMYTHGEGNDYHPTERIMLPLATIVHCADITSARIWFNEGRSSISWE